MCDISKYVRKYEGGSIMKKSMLSYVFLVGAAIFITLGCDNKNNCENVGTNGRSDGFVCPDGYPYSCNGAEHCFQSDAACGASGECG